MKSTSQDDVDYQTAYYQILIQIGKESVRIAIQFGEKAITGGSQ